MDCFSHFHASLFPLFKYCKSRLLTLVMRLTRPTLSSPVVVTCEMKDLPGHLLNACLKSDITSISSAETLSVGQFLFVPQSFG